jgi:NAD(P) transhydrogenase
MSHYDWLVIGSGPAGEKGAVQAAYFGKKVAVIERRAEVGGACVHTGTLPSKTLRETAIGLSGFRQREVYGVDVHIKGGVTLRDLMNRLDQVVSTEDRRILSNLERHGVDLIRGEARFADEHTIDVTDAAGQTRRLTADAVLIAVGTTPYQPPFVPFDDPAVNDSDSILQLARIPASLVVLGGGVIGCEYASIFAALGTRCTIVEGRNQILGFLDDELNAALEKQFNRLGIEMLLEREVVKVERQGAHLHCALKDGHTLSCERLLFAGGRAGNTARLGLDQIGVQPNARGLLKCNAFYQVEGTRDGRVYAAGDVVGFPALASVAMEQGRVAACHAFDLRYKRAVAESFPYGLYTIPEVGMVGLSEEMAKEQGLDYEVGRAAYRDNSRGQITGDVDGLVKLVFDSRTRRLLGVHIIGERATELVHIGATVMHFEGRIDDFIHQVFNFPTLADLYKYAAYDGLGRLAKRGLVDPRHLDTDVESGRQMG